MPVAGERGLVLVRVGASHRISAWLDMPREQRDWDLALSLYEEIELGENACVDVLHRYKGGKWDGIYAFFAANPHLLVAYDYFWLVDDDIEATAAQVRELFTYVRTERFEIAQPALSLDSYYSHRLTLQCEGFMHRHTNFVEIMMPVLSQPVLRQVLPWLESTRSGVGIDWLWYRFTQNPRQSVAIIDAIAVPHRRPLNQHLRGRLRSAGIYHLDERKSLLKGKGVKGHYPVAYAGRLANDGGFVSSRFALAWLMAGSYWRNRNQISAKPWCWFDHAGFSLLQIVRPVRLIGLYRQFWAIANLLRAR